jgi:hypothetical protein
MADVIRLKGAECITAAAEIKDTIKKNGSAALKIQDDSFAPTVGKGEKVKVVKVDPHSLKKGDLVIILANGLVVKRVKKVFQSRGETKVIITDNSNFTEDMKSPSEVVGKVVEIKKANGTVKVEGGNLLNKDLGSMLARFFSKK